MHSSLKPNCRVLDAGGNYGIGVLMAPSSEEAPELCRLSMVRFFGAGPEADFRASDLRCIQLPDRLVVDALDDEGNVAHLDVTWAVLAMSPAEVAMLRDGSPAASALVERFDQRDWPLMAEIERAVRSYFGVADVANLTDERMEQARAAVRCIGPWRVLDGERFGREEIGRLSQGATLICSSEQDNDSEIWYVTRAGQILRVTGLAQDRGYIVDPEEAMDFLADFAEQRQLRMLFGEQAASSLFGSIAGPR